MHCIDLLTELSIGFPKMIIILKHMNEWGLSIPSAAFRLTANMGQDMFYGNKYLLDIVGHFSITSSSPGLTVLGCCVFNRLHSPSKMMENWRVVLRRSCMTWRGRGYLGLVCLFFLPLGGIVSCYQSHYPIGSQSPRCYGSLVYSVQIVIPYMGYG